MSLCVPGDDLVLAAAIMAIAISSNKNADEVNILSGLFSAIGDNLAIIASKKELCEDSETGAAT
jgi:hypothetical protein